MWRTRGTPSHQKDSLQLWFGYIRFTLRTDLLADECGGSQWGRGESASVGWGWRRLFILRH
jgi:hypothetical protein